MQEQMKNQLLGAINEMCYKEGDFTLASGKKSQHYFNLKRLLFDYNFMYNIATYYREIAEQYKVTQVGGMESAALPIAQALVCHWGLSGTTGFYLRKAKSDHGMKDRAEGALYTGKLTMVVEDVATTGQSMVDVVTYLRQRACNPVVVCPIFDREEGAAELIQQYNIPYVPLLTMSQFLKVRQERESRPNGSYPTGPSARIEQGF